MYAIFFILLASMPQRTFAALTSDFDFSLGYNDIDFTIGDSSSNLSSLPTFDGSYNLNNRPWNASFNIGFTAAVDSNQGPLAWTRIALGARYYLSGFGGDRVIFDNKVEGKYLRPALFIGFSVGFSNFSVQSVGTNDGYFNAAAMDYNFRIGTEVVIGPNFFLTGQWSTLLGMPSAGPVDGQTFSYFGNGVLVGLKITSD